MRRLVTCNNKRITDLIQVIKSQDEEGESMRPIHEVVRKLPLSMKRGFAIITQLLILLIGYKIAMRKREERHIKSLAQREAHHRMNEFLGIASHELKTPLTSIKGNVQLMERRLKKNLGEENALPTETNSTLRETRELLERTNQQIIRLSHLVNTLLECARVQTNTLDLLFEVCELDTVIREALEHSHFVPATRTLLVKLPEQTVLVMADPVRIKQVVTQYLSNAHKYSGLSQPIAITLRAEGSLARVEVSDKGPGIPFKEQKRIWERFYRIPGTRVQNGTEIGLGLGLHISKMIVEQHHGHVGVYSAPDAGSIFWFTLPLMREELVA
jgi:signal transduction histidine kinase